MSSDRNIRKKEYKKVEKLQKPKEKLEKRRKLRAKVFPMVVETLRTTTSELEKLFQQE